jgi:hypothetical protein
VYWVRRPNTDATSYPKGVSIRIVSILPLQKPATMIWSVAARAAIGPRNSAKDTPFFVLSNRQMLPISARQLQIPAKTLARPSPQALARANHQHYNAGTSGMMSLKIAWIMGVRDIVGVELSDGLATIPSLMQNVERLQPIKAYHSMMNEDGCTGKTG